jgi:hypothetical protein
MLISPWLRTWKRASRSSTSSRKTVMVISFSGSESSTSHFSNAVNWRWMDSVCRNNPLSTDSFSRVVSGTRTQSVLVSRYERTRSVRY